MENFAFLDRTKQFRSKPWCKLVKNATLVARKIHAKYFVLENNTGYRLNIAGVENAEILLKATMIYNNKNVSFLLRFSFIIY